MKRLTFYALATCLLLQAMPAQSQTLLEVVGDSKVSKDEDATVSLLSKYISETARLELSDNLTYKAGVDYNGLLDLLILRGLKSAGDIFMNGSGKIGVNEEPGDARLFIKQNSTSSYSGLAQLQLEESELTDESFMKFTNQGSAEAWGIAARAGAKLILTKHESLNTTDIMAMDGASFMVGIHQNSPEAYLHIKQQFAGVDALAFEEPDGQGGDKWSFRIGDEDILIYYNGGIRGGFDVSTGNYNAFPPSPAAMIQSKTRTAASAIWELNPGLISTKQGEQFAFDLSASSEQNGLIQRKDGQLGYDPKEVALATFEAFQTLHKAALERQARIDSRLQLLAELERKLSGMERKIALSRE